MPKSPASKSHVKRSPRKAKPEAVDESLWPRSILSSRAERVPGTHEIRITILYRDRDVERIAWRKHGGPEGFYAHLDNLRASHAASKRSRNAFQAPRGYIHNRNLEASTLGVVEVILPAPQPLEQRWTCTSTLLRLREQFPDWLWTAINKELDDRDDRMWSESIHGPPRGWLQAREGIVDKALETLQYPERPAESLPSSPSVDNLRAVLARAPKRGRYGEDVEGVDIQVDYRGPLWTKAHKFCRIAHSPVPARP
ncbi:hypothetical protein AURDEDRAFT_177348 [Auricularia subglabra TFB-10046 SS5]|uniref:Uncharacterized protein n=1 Tax=Auricularia subglabra (strain TFB-10046 / SS5) TaxID=717982 RepID=J0WNZ2_AURST|nr:hypothetical protein AURDEDRAFT_177348 [Auricularia subglabra TFB-10046 SS5]